MTNFANLKNGQITINTYRIPDASVTTLEDLLECYEKETEETLTASIESDEDLRRVESLI